MPYPKHTHTRAHSSLPSSSSTSPSFFFFVFLATPAASGSSWARDQAPATAAVHVVAVTTLDPQYTVPLENSTLYVFNMYGCSHLHLSKLLPFSAHLCLPTEPGSSLWLEFQLASASVVLRIGYSDH